MADHTFNRIEQSQRDRRNLHPRFRREVKTYAALLQLEQAAFRDGALPRRTKELMALGISIVTKCEPCMEWHLEQALLAGAGAAEVSETIDVAIEMGGGPACASARFVLRALDHFHAKHAVPAKP